MPPERDAPLVGDDDHRDAGVVEQAGSPRRRRAAARDRSGPSDVLALGRLDVDRAVAVEQDRVDAAAVSRELLATPNIVLLDDLAHDVRAEHVALLDARGRRRRDHTADVGERGQRPSRWRR